MKTYDEKVEAIKNIINDMSESQAVALHNEWCYETDNYDDEIIEMERFDEICEGMKPIDIARSIVYGDFNPHHDYFHYNSYGNFESTGCPTDWIYPGDIARDVVDLENSFYSYEIQEEINSWEGDEEKEDENSNVTEFHCFNIEYDTDGASAEDIDLPNDLVVKINKDVSDIYGAIANAISDETGWCVLSFEYEEV